MKTFKKVLLVGISIFFLTIISCSSSSEDYNPCGNTDQITQITNAYGNAISAYSLDPSTENCTTLKSTGADYINLLESMLSCASTEDVQSLREAIAEAEAVLNDAC